MCLGKFVLYVYNLMYFILRNLKRNRVKFVFLKETSVIFHAPLKMLRPFEKSYSLLTKYIFTQTIRFLHSMIIIKLNRHTSWDKVEQHLTGWFNYIFHYHHYRYHYHRQRIRHCHHNLHHQHFPYHWDLIAIVIRTIIVTDTIAY